MFKLIESCRMSLWREVDGIKCESQQGSRRSSRAGFDDIAWLQSKLAPSVCSMTENSPNFHINTR